jgi:beta-1,4-mannosyltransferase
MRSVAPPSTGRLEPTPGMPADVPSSSTGIAAFPLISQNPYQRLLYSELSDLGFELLPDAHFKLRWLWAHRRGVGVAHFHWPQNQYRWWRQPASLRSLLSWFKIALFAARLGAARSLGYRIVWTIHEVYPHERSGGRVDRTGLRLLARFSHVLIAHDRGTALRAETELGVSAQRIQLVPHGSYIGVYPPGRSREEVRAELGLSPEAFVFLCFGHVRAYKEIDLLLAAFQAAAIENAALVVAGLAVDRRSAEAVRLAADRDERIKHLLEFIPDENVAELFAASDVAVLPRSDGGTSGALVLALSLGIAVVAARIADYEDLTGGDVAGWLFDPGDPDALRFALEASADRAAARTKGAAGLSRAKSLRWPQIAARTAALIRDGDPALPTDEPEWTAS